MNRTTEHACGTMRDTHISAPGAALTAPVLIATYEEVPMAVEPTRRPRPPQRKKFTQRQKWLVFERHGVLPDGQEHTVECFYCGKPGTAVVIAPGDHRRVWSRDIHRYIWATENKWWVRSSFDIDHVRSVARGGKHETWNLVPACMTCNASKCDRTLGEWFDLLADKRRTKHPRRLAILERFGAN